MTQQSTTATSARPADNDPLTILLEGVHRLRLAFAKLNLEPPGAVILPDHATGMRLLAAISSSPTVTYHIGPNGHAKPVEHPDGSVWMEFTVMDVAFRWPANRYAQEAGGYLWG